MFGFSKEEKAASQIAKQFSATMEIFTSTLTMAAMMKNQEPPDPDDRLLAVMFGFMDSICQVSGQEPSTGYKALSIYFSSYSDSSAMIRRIMTIQSDPDYGHLVEEAGQAYWDACKNNDPSGSYFRLASVYMS